MTSANDYWDANTPSRKSFFLSGNGISDIESPTLNLYMGNTYVFRYTDSTYPFVFYGLDDFGGDYGLDANPILREYGNIDITYDTINKEVTIIIPLDAEPVTLNYMSSESQSYMGSTVEIRDSNVAIVSQEQKSLAFILETNEKPYTVTAPGLYSLTGDRYIILRCPQIEQHLYRSRAYERYTMGLAKFKLSVYGYDDTRFDYSKTPIREFHPIGKLSQLSFRFERPDGELYNFKGINHTLTFVVQYYEPVQQGEFDKYTLNPDYDPDYFRYIQNQESESESGSDSD
jgi:hypothetical protein